MNTKTLNLVKALAYERERGIFVWLFNIGAEDIWHSSPKGIPDPDEQSVVNRMEEMNLLICRSQDIMILRERPEPALLDMLSRLGFSQPHIEVPAHADPLTPISDLVLADAALLQRLHQWGSSPERGGTVCLVPYAVTAKEEEIAARCSFELIGAPSLLCARVNDKIFSRHTAQLLGFPVSEGAICQSEDDIRRECERLTAGVTEPIRLIIKQPHGASGKGMYMLDDVSKLGTLLRVMRRFAGSLDAGGLQNGWLVERWHDKEMDLNYQMFIDAAGGVNVFSLKIQYVDGTVYTGSRMPAELDASLEAEIERCARQLGTYLYSIGYTGIASIDGFVGKGGLLIPVIEINGRFTLSTYLSFVSEILGPQKGLSRYYRKLTLQPLSYNQLCTFLADQGLLYTPERRAGVIVYTSGTLSGASMKSSNVSRIFTLTLADDWGQAEQFVDQLEQVMAQL